MQAEKASEQDADLKVIVEKEDTDMDHICIELHGGKGKIQADSQVGVLIAVYRLFHEFGVRYLRPGRKNEFFQVLSENDWAEKEISIEETASFRHRGVCIEGADSYENLRDFIDWLPKIGMNTFFIQFENPYSFFKRWYEHEFNPYAEKEPFNTEIAQEMSDRIDQEMKIRGIVASSCRSWMDWGSARIFFKVWMGIRSYPSGREKTSCGRIKWKKRAV